MDKAKRLMWIWLKLCLNDNSKKVYEVYKHFNSIEAVISATNEEYKQLSFLTEEEIGNLMNKNTYAACEMDLCCQQNHISLISIECDEYPKEFLELETPPCLLFTYGNYKLAMSKPKVTIVGTRKCTHYGENITNKISSALSMCGCTIVTGVAEGVDNIAYSATEKTNGSAIVIVPCGFLASDNTRYKTYSYERSVAISEHLIDRQQTKYAYHERNRLLSALSPCTVVTQAPESSGALITANYALEQGKDLFAVPANIDLTQSVGSNKLFFDGAAPVLNYKDILEYMIKKYPDKVQTTLTEEIIETNTDAKFKIETAILNTKKLFFPTLDTMSSNILDLFGETAVTFDYLLTKTNYRINELNSCLTILETAGAIESLPGNRYKLNIKSR